MSSGGHKTSAIPRPKAPTRTRTHGAKPSATSTRKPAAKPTARPKIRPNDKSKLTAKAEARAKAKPNGTANRKANDTANDKGRDDSRFADFTRPISIEKQLVRGGGKRRLVGIGAAVITAAFIAALFVLPVQAWLRQQDDLDHKDAQLAALQDANAQLSNEVIQLQTPEGIEKAAREEIGYVQRGETRYTMLPTPTAPIALPGGWPYSTISQIVAVRTAAFSNP
ncbi:hypothetical protein BH10ACT2_BH10ACT2_17900 [soil metagenome]